MSVVSSGMTSTLLLVNAVAQAVESMALTCNTVIPKLLIEYSTWLASAPAEMGL